MHASGALSIIEAMTVYYTMKAHQVLRKTWINKETVEADVKDTNYSWETTQRIAGDKYKWANFGRRTKPQGTYGLYVIMHLLNSGGKRYRFLNRIAAECFIGIRIGTEFSLNRNIFAFNMHRNS